MTINEICQLIITIGGTIGALLAIVGFLGKIFGWFQKQNDQDSRIAELSARHDKDIHELKTEMQLLTYGILAALKGLSEQGCNGPVTEAIDKIEKHINERAHK